MRCARPDYVRRASIALSIGISMGITITIIVNIIIISTANTNRQPFSQLTGSRSVTL